MSTIFKFIASHKLEAISRPFFGQWILFNAWHIFLPNIRLSSSFIRHTLLPVFPIIPISYFLPPRFSSFRAWDTILGNRNLEVRLIASNRVATKWRYEEKTQGCCKKRGTARRDATRCSKMHAFLDRSFSAFSSTFLFVFALTFVSTLLLTYQRSHTFDH